MKTAPPMRSGLLKINHVYASKSQYVLEQVEVKPVIINES